MAAVVNLALVKARKDARLSQDGLARKVRDAGRRLGTSNGCARSTVARWEAGEAIPQPQLLACLEEALGVPAEALGFGEAADPWLAPPGFPAAALAGTWVTAYQFPHGGQQLHHADIAQVTADGDRHVRAANEAARTEGRAVPFGNEITAQLSGRHLTGTWHNTTDRRYFGCLHLAVLPGETVMDGYYTGLATDISVSLGRWRWVRLEAALSFGLRDPAEVWKVVTGYDPYGPPLGAAAIGEDT
jgi:transcriptional regulator with XRE-family HTH domain